MNVSQKNSERGMGGKVFSFGVLPKANRGSYLNLQLLETVDYS